MPNILCLSPSFDLTSLSNVTAAFYGLSLKHILDRIWQRSNLIAFQWKILWFSKMKAIQCRDKMPDFPYDSQSICLNDTTAIYFKSRIRFFTIKWILVLHETVLKLEGANRYLKILKRIGQQRSNRTSHSGIMEGINDGPALMLKNYLRERSTRKKKYNQYNICSLQRNILR
jgi:hypothetical protein